MRSTIFHSNASVVNWQGCAATGGVCERGPDDVGRRKNGGCLIATSSSPARSYITPTSFICPNFIFHSHLHVMVADMILLSPTQHLLAPTSSHFDRLCHFLSVNNLSSLFIYLQSPISNSTRRQQVATLVLFTTHSHTGNLSTQSCMECYLCMRHVLVEILV